MIELSEEQRQDVQSGKPVRVSAPELGGEVVLLSSDTYNILCDQLDDDREKAAWARLARKSTESWAQENPFGP